MKLKITHITQFLGVGGLEKVLELLILEQMKSGHDVKLVVYDYEKSWVTRFEDAGIRVEHAYQKQNGYDIKLLNYLAQQISGSDIVHTHDINPALYISPLKLIFKMCDKKFPRFIHTAHGMDHIHRRPITKLYEAVITFFTDKTIGVGQAVCDIYHSFGFSNDKVGLIENGTQLPNEVTKGHKEKLCDELGLDSNRPLWAAIARIVPLKNQKMIINLAKLRPDINFLLIGPSGDQAYWNELENIRPANVLMLGSRSDINQILSSVDIFISASTHEGIPLSVLEAGALNVPCLLSDIPGHRTLQDQTSKEVALYFQLNDLTDLSEKAKKLTNEYKRLIANNLFEHVSNNYSSKAMYQKYLSVYLDENA